MGVVEQQGTHICYRGGSSQFHQYGGGAAVLQPSVTIITPSTGCRQEYLLDAASSIERAKNTGLDVQWVIASPEKPPVSLECDYVALKEPLSPSRARNAALERARGDFVVNLDDDDMLSLDFSASLIDGLYRDTVYAAYSADWFPETDTHHIWEGQLPPGFHPPGEVSLLWLADTYPIAMHPSTLIVPRHTLEGVGGWDDSLEQAEDIDLAACLMVEYGIVMLDVVTHYYRKHPGQMTRSKEVMQRDHEVIQQVYSRYGISVVGEG
mgnify:CR=1 FL=1